MNAERFTDRRYFTFSLRVENDDMVDIADRAEGSRNLKSPVIFPRNPRNMAEPRIYGRKRDDVNTVVTSAAYFANLRDSRLPSCFGPREAFT